MDTWCFRLKREDSRYGNYRREGTIQTMSGSGNEGVVSKKETKAEYCHKHHYTCLLEL